MNARENRNVFSLDLNVPSESLSVTVLGREFQMAGAEHLICSDTCSERIGYEGLILFGAVIGIRGN